MIWIGFSTPSVTFTQQFRQMGDDVGGLETSLTNMVCREVTGCRVQAGAAAGCDEWIQALREEPTDDAGKHIAGAGGGHARIASGANVDFGRAGIGGRYETASAFQKCDAAVGIGELLNRREAILIDLIGLATEHPRGFSGVRGEDTQLRSGVLEECEAIAVDKHRQVGLCGHSQKLRTPFAPTESWANNDGVEVCWERCVSHSFLRCVSPVVLRWVSHLQGHDFGAAGEYRRQMFGSGGEGHEAGSNTQGTFGGHDRRAAHAEIAANDKQVTKTMFVGIEIEGRKRGSEPCPVDQCVSPLFLVIRVRESETVNDQYPGGGLSRSGEHASFGAYE